MTETAAGDLIPRRDKPAEGEVEETELGYKEAIEARPGVGEVEETEAGYAKAKEEQDKKNEEGEIGSCLEGGREAGTDSNDKEKERWAEKGWVSWKQNPESGKWSEEEVRAEHERENADRLKKNWGGYGLDREPDVHKYPCPRGTRAGLGNRMAEWAHDRWTPQCVVTRNWQNHWKFKSWEAQCLRPQWRTDVQWEISKAWNDEGHRAAAWTPKEDKTSGQ